MGTELFGAVGAESRDTSRRKPGGPQIREILLDLLGKILYPIASIIEWTKETPSGLLSVNIEDIAFRGCPIRE
jgi:hypothetical protein